MTTEIKIDDWLYPVAGRILGGITNHTNINVGVSPVSVTSEVVGKRGDKIVTLTGTEYSLKIPHTSCKFTKESLLEILEEI